VNVERIREISRAAEEYVTDRIGDAVSTGTPMHGLEDGGWSIPIFCDTEFGYLRCGDLRLADSGELVSAPSREEVDSTVRNLVAKLESE
jgi:hypothetical protein